MSQLLFRSVCRAVGIMLKMETRSACWYYFDISSNGEIPDDELNYQTSNINSIETTSTMKWKILVRRLGSDMTKVVVQMVVPNDYSKQDQHNQRKQLNHLDSICLTPNPIDHHDSICSNPDLLKRTHPPQGMSSLIDPTGCCVMKRKDGECPDPEVKSYHRGVYRRCIGKLVANMDYTWGDN